jgi:hypothetical protein
MLPSQRKAIACLPVLGDPPIPFNKPGRDAGTTELQGLEEREGFPITHNDASVV